jgi:urease accessory protein
MLGHQPQPPPSPDRPGRDGLLRLAFERRGNATTLRRCRYKLPLQVLSPLTLDDGTSYLLLLNPTGGVLGGDHLHTEITLEENASVCLSTPSATRIYRTAAAPAEIDTVLRVASNATIEYLPDHVIPHPGSSLRQSLHVEMSEGSRGIFLDTLAAGRAALSEQWNFRDYDSRTKVFLRSNPVYLNRTKIQGSAAGGSAPLNFGVIPTKRSDKRSLFDGAASSPPATLGRMSDYSYSGALLIVADQFADWRPVVTSLRSELEALPGLLGGVSLLSHAGCSARYIAKSAVDFRAATTRLWTCARQQVLSLPPLDLRKY